MVKVKDVDVLLEIAYEIGFNHPMVKVKEQYSSRLIAITNVSTTLW